MLGGGVSSDIESDWLYCREAPRLTQRISRQNVATITWRTPCGLLRRRTGGCRLWRNGLLGRKRRILCPSGSNLADIWGDVGIDVLAGPADSSGENLLEERIGPNV